MRLEKREIDALSCPPGKQDALFFDDHLTGYGMRVTAAGTKVFIFQYKRGTAVRRMAIGRYGQITPAKARAIAEEARGHVAAGRDPMGMKAATLAAEAEARTQNKRHAAVRAYTLEKLVEDWATTGLSKASVAHRRDAPAAIRRVFKAHLASSASILKPKDMQAAIDALTKVHPVAARRARDYAKAMANWGLSRELVTANPFATVRIEGAAPSRDRALSDPELGAVWRAAGTLGYPFGPLVRLLILTMQRRAEVAAMEWGELDHDLTLWTLPAPRAKNRKEHIVHLPEAARAILRELRERPRPADQTLIFTTTGTTPVSGFSRAVEQLQAAIEAEPAGEAGPVQWAGGWTLHDLRRTAVTTLARRGVLPHVADRMLNHVGGSIRGVALVYQKHDFWKERQAAAELWAAHVLTVAAAGAPRQAPGNVVPLPVRKR